ncbi:hypothetical protein ACQ4PT_048530 [Festuca glaucescens]
MVTQQLPYGNSHLFSELNICSKVFTCRQIELAHTTGFRAFSKPLHEIQFDRQFTTWLITKVDTINSERLLQEVPGGSTSACEELFYLRPKIQYNLAACKKVVVSLDMKQEGWASLTIDFRRCITYLIHPNLSAACPVEVLHHHIDLMKILTQAAQEHMTRHGGAVIPMVEWEYEVALKSEHHMNGPESGFTTAFYSIPKDNQFMIVSPETIGLAKHTFLYSMVRMSYRSTKRKIPQGKRKKVLKRGRDGKFIPHDDPEGSGTASGSDAGSSA